MTDEVVKVGDMVSNILEHHAVNADYYKQFHTGDLLQDVEGYFKFGNYSDCIVNVIIIATVKALHMNCQSIRKGQMEIYR